LSLSYIKSTVKWNLLHCNYCAYCFDFVICSVLYGCEMLSFTLKEEYRSRVSENRLLKRIFGP
jgi:hypothetical protein